MIDQLTTDQINQVLYRQTIARLGCAVINKPYIVPISYAFDGKYLYGCSKEGQKISIMRKNPSVCLEVDQIDNMRSWQCVIIQGKYEEVKTAAEQNRILKFIRDKFIPLVTSTTLVPRGLDASPHYVEKEKKAVIFKIKIETMSGRYEKP